METRRELQTISTGLDDSAQEIRIPGAAACLLTGLRAWHALTRAGALRPDATVLIEGTGGVSLFALPLPAAFVAKPYEMESVCEIARKLLAA